MNSDTDGDGLNDGYEVKWGLDPFTKDDIKADPDNDGLSTEFESYIGTDPTNPDTDGDGFSDGEEVRWNTNPLDPNDYPQIPRQRDYTNLVYAIFIGVIILALAAGSALLITRQFRPEKAKDRKELEREEKRLIASATSDISWGGREIKRKFVPSSSQAMAFSENEEKETEPKLPERKEGEVFDLSNLETMPTKEQRIAPPPATAAATEQPTIPKKRPATPSSIPQEPADVKVLEMKRDEIKTLVEDLKDYQRKLEDLKTNRMNAQAISAASREGLTEYAAESQSLYSEAKAIWNSSILPIIKGYEEPLEVDTLKAEEVIDKCRELAEQILEILVQRELALSQKEEKKELIKSKAVKALEEEKSKEEKTE